MTAGATRGGAEPSSGLCGPLLVRSEEAFRAALTSRADALLVAPSSEAARAGWLELVQAPRRGDFRPAPDVYAEIDPEAPDSVEGLGSTLALLRGVILPSAEPAEIERLAAQLAVAEAERGLEDGQLRILGVVSDARSALSLTRLPSPEPRLAGLIFDEVALSSATGTAPDCAPVATARGLTLLAARALGVPALAGTGFGAADGDVQIAAKRAARDGFTAKIAASLEELATIAAVFRR